MFCAVSITLNHTVVGMTSRGVQYFYCAACIQVNSALDSKGSILTAGHV